MRLQQQTALGWVTKLDEYFYDRVRRACHCMEVGIIGLLTAACLTLLYILVKLRPLSSSGTILHVVRQT